MKQADKLAVAAAVEVLREFINPNQLKTIVHYTRGEEGAFFIEKLTYLAAVVNTMPKTYETEERGLGPIAHLHYFSGGGDWYITERDVGTPEEPGQHQAFGCANLGHGPELGYISIVELLAVRGFGREVELDLHFAPTPLRDIKKAKDAVTA